MAYFRRQTRALNAIVFVLCLSLSACGQAAGDATSNTISHPQGDAMNAQIPDGPDAPVSGLPGQPGDAIVGGLVQGTVVDQGGRPLTHVVITPQSTDTPPQPVPEIAVFTDDQGRYKWSLAPGAYTFTFVHDGYVPLTKAVNVANNHPTPLDVVLQQ
jgi:hypothetical protein